MFLLLLCLVEYLAMYQTLTFYHSIVRWLVLLSLVYSIVRAYRGYLKDAVFTSVDNHVRHWTATIAHIQLVVGVLLYTKSPAVRYLWTHFSVAVREWDLAFFGLVHMLLMLTAITLITIGSSLAKRKLADRDKFKTILIWYVVALIIIFIAIPWPFSPLAARPYFR